MDAANVDLDGRVAIVTGAGDGLGRAEALALGHAGARVVVNDIGDRAHEVVEELGSAGIEAEAVVGDVGDWSIGDRLVGAAVDRFGRLDVVVNNAGILRDGMLFNLTESQWDDVIRVHLKGHAAVSRAAATHWRSISKAGGGPVDASVINTASEAFLFGSPGQPNYAAAKAGITALTLSTAHGLSRHGVRANAICPRARTAMTEGVFGDSDTDGLDPLAPERVATFVTYLASPASAAITAQVFVVYDDFVALLSAPSIERKFTAAGGAFTVDELADQLGGYFADREPRRSFAAYELAALDRTTANA